MQGKADYTIKGTNIKVWDRGIYELQDGYTPDWSDSPEASFVLDGHRYFPSGEFTYSSSMWASGNNPLNHEFDAHMNDTYFSGIGLKFEYDGEVHVFRFTA